MAFIRFKLSLTIGLIWPLLLLSSHKQWFDDCGACLEKLVFYSAIRTHFYSFNCSKSRFNDLFIATTYSAALLLRKSNKNPVCIRATRATGPSRQNAARKSPERWRRPNGASDGPSNPCGYVTIDPIEQHSLNPGLIFSPGPGIASNIPRNAPRRRGASARARPPALAPDPARPRETTGATSV